MASEKTPALYLKKMSFDDEQKERFCSKSTISWIFAAVLVALLVIVSIQFLYPTVDNKLRMDKVHVFKGQPIEVNVITSGISDGNKEAATNPWDFGFLIDPINLCRTRNPPNSQQYEQNPDVKLLMLVPSAVDHFTQRKTIRNTWGSVAEKHLGPMRLGFVLGTSENQTINDLIYGESLEYGDIIQADFVDSYYHLTIKSVLMLKWVAMRCPHAQYFLKADDDTFVNVGIIANILGTERFLSKEKFIGGYVHTGAQPSRIPEEKYYISEDDYPYEEYPPYASGSAYVMTGPTAVDLFDASKVVQPFIPMEDVFVTGLCAEHIDAPRIHEPRFRYDHPPNPPSWETFSTLATAHSVTPDILEQVWDDMTRSVLSHLFNQEVAINSTVLLRKKRNL